VRGKGAPLKGIKRSLASAGFSKSEEYLTLPHHAAPRLVVNAQQGSAERKAWVAQVASLYRASEVAEEEIVKWWRAVCSEGLEKELAPGWLVLAHNHAVHSVLWTGAATKFFVPVAEAENHDNLPVESVEGQHTLEASPDDNAATTTSISLATSELVSAVLNASRPVVNGVKDYKESLIAADQRIDDLSFRESVAREQLSDTQEALASAEERHSKELTSEQEARRIREAELGLVLKQYHSVGAMCHDMREEGRKLKDMLDELKRRYVASEEWGTALAKRVAEAEQELHQTQSWLPYRWVQRLKGLVGSSAKRAAVAKRVGI
jgi:hypothetical protein